MRNPQLIMDHQLWNTPVLDTMGKRQQETGARHADPTQEQCGNSLQGGAALEEATGWRPAEGVEGQPPADSVQEPQG